jgi:cytochrome c553
MRRFTTRQRLITMTALGATLLGGLTVLRLDAQTTDRRNPVRAAYMRAHFNQVLSMHDAVARGDLAEAKKQAAALATAGPNVPMPPGAEAFHGALTQAARDAANATTLADAAQATATMLGTCGQCHKANSVRATVPPGKAIVVGGLVGHMLLHQKGADDLLEGLVAPSETQWVEGVRIFASPKLEAEHVPGKMRKTMEHGETELAVLAGHAAQAHRTRDRTEIYGQVLTTCGTCHRGHSRFAGPDRR